MSDFDLVKAQIKPQVKKGHKGNLKGFLKDYQKSTNSKIKETERHKLSGHSHNPLASFCYYPDKVKFINTDPEEKIILLLRRHPITNFKWVATSFLMILVPPFFPVILPYDILPSGFQIVFGLTWYLLTSAFIIEEFLIWFFHVNIITDERIIEVDFVNMIYREVTDANIDQIQDVTVGVGGFIRTYFNYGELLIQTAAEITKVEFEAIPFPDKVAKILRELRIEEQEERMEGRAR